MELYRIREGSKMGREDIIIEKQLKNIVKGISDLHRESLDLVPMSNLINYCLNINFNHANCIIVHTKFNAIMSQINLVSSKILDFVSILEELNKKNLAKKLIEINSILTKYLVFLTESLALNRFDVDILLDLLNKINKYEINLLKSI